MPQVQVLPTTDRLLRLVDAMAGQPVVPGNRRTGAVDEALGASLRRLFLFQNRLELRNRFEILGTAGCPFGADQQGEVQEAAFSSQKLRKGCFR